MDICHLQEIHLTNIENNYAIQKQMLPKKHSIKQANFYEIK